MVRPGSRRLTAGAVLLVGLCLSACTYRTSETSTALPEVAQTSRIMAADGSLLATLRAEQNRDVVRLEQIPRSLQDAVVAIEDERFWLHRGIDVRAILRAAGTNASAREITEGGSTITQQYVKVALLDPTRTVNRKLEEAVLAWRLEQSHSKEEILERYLNTIYFGQGAYGAAAAAGVYFGKPVGELTVAESALLAGVIRAPGTDDPYSAPEPALARRRMVLDRMLALGRLGPGEHAAALAEPVQLRPRVEATERYDAPHFVEAVKQWILTDTRFGATEEDRRDLLFGGGLRITTTLDRSMQAQAEAAVAGVLPEPGTFPEGALVALEPATGFVRAMVGGRDYFGGSAFAKVNLAMGEGRQAGSTFKPLVLAAALDRGIPLSRTYPAPATTEIPLGRGVAPWRVSNYGGSRGGTVSLVDATVWSYNTAYARLMTDVGAGAAVDVATRLGITSPLQAVPAAVLGTENVTVLEMASAYGTFANRGQHLPPALVTRITRADGRPLYEHQAAGSAAVPATVADEVTGVLRQVINRGTGTAARLGRPAAGKTGTAEGYRDAWFVGYTPQLAAAVWVGFAETQEPMVPPTTPLQVTGGSWPAEIWQQFMAAATAGAPVIDFPPPAGSTARFDGGSRAGPTAAAPSSSSTTATEGSGGTSPGSTLPADPPGADQGPRPSRSEGNGGAPSGGDGVTPGSGPGAAPATSTSAGPTASSGSTSPGDAGSSSGAGTGAAPAAGAAPVPAGPPATATGGGATGAATTGGTG